MTEITILSEAIRLYREDQIDASRAALRSHLLADRELVNKLLWLAKVSSDEREAIAAAELALALEPTNEVAQRGVVAVHQRFAANGSGAPVIDVMRISGLTQAQARLVNWPFRGLNRPIGVLFDEGVIDLKDLVFAIQKAYDAQVKKAATTLLLAHLLGEGLKDPPPPMKVVDGGSYAARNERLSLLGSGAVLAITGGLVLILLAILAIQITLWISGSPWVKVLNLLSCLSIVTIAPLTYGFMGLLDKLQDQAENYRAGVKGENAFADAIRASLRSPWALFRNVDWPERKWGDVDAVLVGPGGIWAIEVKAYNSDIRNLGEKWQFKTRWGWRNLSKSPGQQAIRNALNVKNYLDLHGLRVSWVQAVVVWAGEESKLTVEDPAVPVWTLSKLSEQIEELWQQEKLTFEQVQKASEILNEVIEKDLAKQAEQGKKVSDSKA